MFSQPPHCHSNQGNGGLKLSEKEYSEVLSRLESLRQSSILDVALLGHYPETVSDSIFIESGAVVPDCQMCGACCVYFHQIPVQIQDATPRSLTWRVYESDDPDETPLYWLRRDLKTGNCIVFEGKVGENAHCIIFTLRPQSCRAFEAGSDRCHALRRIYGMETALSEAERLSHLQILNERHLSNEGSGNLNIASVEIDQSAWLCELIDYNLGKLTEISREIDRVLALLEEINNCEVTAFCEQSRLEITDNYRAIADTLAPIVIHSDTAFRELLQIGNFSQESVERAAEQLAQIGEWAFEISGMKKSVENAVLRTED